MRRTGLKTHITITLILLLGTGMLLANIVIIFLWQQSMIQTEANRLIGTMNIAAQNKTAGSSPLVLYTTLNDILAPDCLLIESAVGRELAADRSCQYYSLLKSSLGESLKTGRPAAQGLGSTWGVFSLRPEYLLVTTPVNLDGFPGGIGVISSLRPMYSSIRHSQKIVFIYLLVNLLILVVIGFFRLVKTTVKPVERLVAMTEAYDESNSFLFSSSREGNEFGQLNASLNRMTQRIENDRRQLRETVSSLEAANQMLQKNQNEMVKAEKLAAVGRLSAGLAHEIGNPIGIIMGYLELLQKESLSGDERQQFSQRAANELNRVNHLIRQLLDFARSSPAQERKIHINSLLQDTVDLFKARKNMDNIAFHLNLNTTTDAVYADGEGLRQVFFNCLINAVDAIAEKGPEFAGKIIIKTNIQNNDSGSSSIRITIKDNGPGIPQGCLGSIFDPFFTTKEPGKGTGLGLSVSHTIVESAGGKFTVSSSSEEGTEMSITLPLLENTINNVQELSTEQ